MHGDVNVMDFDNRFAAARREAISRDFYHLNSRQREAVLTTEGPLLLLAGAGSGKTTVLIDRIANLLKYGRASDSDDVPCDVTESDLLFLEEYAGTPSDGNQADSSGNPLNDDRQVRVRELCSLDRVDPREIIAITFTNKAAGEMKRRLARLPGCIAEDIWAMTFHSACSRILRRNIDNLGYDRSFTIYDAADSTALMKRILKDLDIDDRDFAPKTVLNYISRAKDEMNSAGDFIAAAEKNYDMRRKIIGKAYAEYETRMKSSNSLDFDDLILLTVRLFRQCPDVLRYYQRRFKYVLVDEYQDTNNLQYLLASDLAGGYGNICVVGDDDQSIYKFRGATIENILSFEKHFSDARVIRLEQNYRSTGLILSAANDVIRNNKGRKGKNLWTRNDAGKKPELHITSDERSEAQFIADTVIASVAKGRKWQEHAVLYRMNAQSNQLETAFKRAGIPYRVFGGTGFYDRAEIKDMIAYLCVIYNPNDDVRLLRVINNPPRGIGDTTVNRLTELAARLDRPVFEAIPEAQNHEGLKSAYGRLQQFAAMIGELRSLMDTLPLDELYDELLNKTGYIRMLEEKRSDESGARVENVRELKTNIISFVTGNGGTLFDFLSETALLTDLDRDDSNTDRAVMMTMHSAKGLEFDTVFVAGAEEGLFPGARSIGEPEEMEEERRLCYVAMTRAMRALYFTSARRRMIFGKTSSSQPSRFIREISGENIEIVESPGGFSDFDNGFTGFNFEYGSGFDSPNPYTRTETSQGFNRSSGPGRKAGSLEKRSASRAPSFAPGSHQAVPDIKEGDAVEHEAFGPGVVTSLTPGGGDTLVEILFESSGKKRLLLNSASKYMKKRQW